VTDFFTGLLAKVSPRQCGSTSIWSVQ